MKQRNFRLIETNGIRLRTVWSKATGHWSFCCMDGRSAGICGVTKYTLERMVEDFLDELQTYPQR